jgi:cytochrome oxidase Cu insertion factor (SCO1/SenC/PrrC family)
MFAVVAALLVASTPGILGVGEQLPPLTLTDQDGKQVNMDALGGRSVLLSFVSTRQASTAFCPAVTAKFLYMQQHLPNSGYRLVQVTRDARADSPQRLRRYADEFGARTSDWRFLTGGPADVAQLIAALGAGSAKDGYEQLYFVSSRGTLLGALPAGDWSPVDALAWATSIERPVPGESPAYSGKSATMDEPKFSARLLLQGTSLNRRLDLIEFDRSPQDPIRSYVTDMTKLLHLIVVSDDLLDFQHVHPVLGPDGHFRLAIAFSRPVLYHIYADATPQDHSHAVFRFDAAIGNTKAAKQPTGVSGDTASVGPYTVRLSEVRVPARQDVPLLVAVQRGGLPAMDLRPYLGAYAHIVAIGIPDLSYMHAHPSTGSMTMGNMAAAPALADTAMVPATMTVHLNFPRSGLYRIWVQFRGGSGTYAAPFVIQAT